jgi:site-specific recombinase XerD
MKPEYFISYYLDVRRPKKNGKYPLKLRMFTSNPRKQKLYNTVFDFTEKEFTNIWETLKPRNEHKKIRLKLQALENKANDVASKLPYFTFEAFERSFLGKINPDRNSVVLYYDKVLIEYYNNNQLGTASSYELSLKSLLNFHGKDSLTFYDITPSWLKGYESWMLNKKKLSRTTVGIYLRPLRAVFNNAIYDNAIDHNAYPFGKRKYQIPAPKGVKKALSKDQLKKLFEAVPLTSEQQKAKDFWFFSYVCNGMNIKDIAYLKYKDFSGEILTFRRAKTINTNMTQPTVLVYLNDFSTNVINKYGNRNKIPDNYIFDIIDSKSETEDQRKQVKNFIRFINQHFLKYTKSLGIDSPVSTYWARHSFATTAIRNGASMEYVSEALNHSNLNTTRNYFAGFEDDKKREINKKLLEF